MYEEQSARDLTLVLAMGRIGPEQFGIFGRGNIADGGPLTITATVIGASHVINLSYDDREVFSELFACVEFACDIPHLIIPPWDDRGRISKIEFRADSATLRYSFCPRLLSVGDGRKETERIAEAAVRAENNGHELGLIHEFPPEPHETCGSRTIVLVRWDREKRAISTETVHEYLNEDRVAFTRSIISILPPS
ncbi:DUF2617 family protein [Candidatus Uhrbacteria bacterium]|nr:DUF2617 family protein [Candidatus Uhrbacteria bacterium]